MIRVKNLELDFSGRLHLYMDEFLIGQGEILGLMGPNGAGKSTFLRILALFQKPLRGSIEIHGKNILDIKDKTAYRRGISFVFAQPYLFNRSVYENIVLPLGLRGIRDKGAVDEMLDLFKISHLKKNMAPTLSEGEKHRVCLARAFVSRPELILLDEPFLSLDARFKQAILNDLRRIIKLNKTTAIFVSHEQHEALSIADSMAVMMAGKILQRARPEDIFTRPASRAVADFAGIDTIIEGLVIKKEDNLCFIKVNNKVIEVVSACDKNDDVFVCIRPESVTIAKHQDLNSARNHFNAKVTDIQPWQLGYRLNLDCGFNLSASVTGQSIKDLDLKIGGEVVASFKATAAHLIRR